MSLTHTRPADIERTSMAIIRQELEEQGLTLPEGAEGSVCPVARREAAALWAVAAKGGKATRSAPKGSASPVGCWAKGPKRPEGVSKYKGRARSVPGTPIFARAAKP